MRRALALALTALAVGAAPAFADPGIVFDADGRTIVVGADQLAAAVDVGPATYVVDGVSQSLTGTSVRTALTLAGADPDAVSAVTASADVTLLQLTRPQLAQAPPFPEGPALVWVDAEGRTSLLRPATPDGRAGQLIRSAPGQPLAATIEGATPLEVAIIASVENAKPGARVPLLAQSSVEGATYTWDFGDGTTAEGAQVDHAFTRPGRYRVTVAVADGAGGRGTSEPVTIVVGAPKRRTAHSVRATDAKRDSAASAAPAPTPAPAPAVAPERAASAPQRARPARRAQRPRKRRERRAVTRKPDHDAVAGTLLADVSSPASLAVRQAVVAAPSTGERGGFHVPAAVFVALCALVVLSLGAWAERRRLR